jgi:hypothetical protein
MYVVGATKAEYFTEVRKLSLIVLLVPESTRRKPFRSMQILRNE